jgi:hypothetical protein
MSVQIIEVVKGESYTVNGKNVYKDSENNWIAREELTTAESQAFRESRGNNFTNLKVHGYGR